MPIIESARPAWRAELRTPIFRQRGRIFAARMRDLVPASPLITRVSVVLFFLAVVVDRIAWARVAQWREDQGLSMWLGYHLLDRLPPVGLVNSVRVPNPNGIALVAWALTALPSLLAVSATLGLIFVVSAVAACRMTDDRRWFTLAAVLCTSVQLRGASVELWAQWLMIPLNLAFIAAAAAYLRSPRTWLWIVTVALILLGPSLYLAGAVNAVAYAVIWCGVVVHVHFVRRRAAEYRLRALWTISGVGALITAAVVLTWIPYFGAVQMTRLESTRVTNDGRSSAAFAALIGAPAGIGRLIRTDLAPIPQSDPRIVPSSAFSLMRASSLALSLEALVAACAFVIVIRNWKSGGSRNAARLTVLAAAVLALSYPLSPLLGGFSWQTGARVDQAIQFLPLLLISLFAVPAASERRWIRRAAGTLAMVFCITNMLAGWITIAAHLNYRGSAITEADVPLVQKTEAIDWIVRDWTAHGTANSSADIPIAYELTGKWHFLSQWGRLTSEWHPAAMTPGRSLDYDLARRFGLHNAFEGMFPRPNWRAVYVISYAFEPRPIYVRRASEERIFGRLRVSIIRSNETREKAVRNADAHHRTVWEAVHNTAEDKALDGLERF